MIQQKEVKDLEVEDEIWMNGAWWKITSVNKSNSNFIEFTYEPVDTNEKKLFLLPNHRLETRSKQVHDQPLPKEVETP